MRVPSTTPLSELEEAFRNLAGDFTTSRQAANYAKALVALAHIDDILDARIATGIPLAPIPDEATAA